MAACWSLATMPAAVRTIWARAVMVIELIEPCATARAAPSRSAIWPAPWLRSMASTVAGARPYQPVGSHAPISAPPLVIARPRLGQPGGTTVN
jgi:hypothetical protein